METKFKNNVKQASELYQKIQFDKRKIVDLALEVCQTELTEKINPYNTDYSFTRFCKEAKIPYGSFNRWINEFRKRSKIEKKIVKIDEKAMSRTLKRSSRDEKPAKMLKIYKEEVKGVSNVIRLDSMLEDINRINLFLASKQIDKSDKKQLKELYDVLNKCNSILYKFFSR